MIIPRPKGPRKKIDIYLQPLVDELKQLWEVGVITFDSFKNQNFNMHAVVLWTINDFPTYRNLSSWNTMSALVCPSCHNKTHSSYLKNGRKFCFMGHRCFLPIKHRWRLESKKFDGKKKLGLSPKQLSGDDVLGQLCDLEFLIFRDGEKKRKHDELNKKDNWLKKTIFFK